jgi:hypothetical protein
MEPSVRLLGLRQPAHSHLVRTLVGVCLVALGALSAVGASCNTPHPSTLPDGGDACNAMCANERTINATDPCPGYTGAPSPGGTSCEDACHAQDPTFNLHAACVAQATSCASMKACFSNQ